MYLSKNSWGNLEYKGINTRWVTRGGQRFEVQFHTPESFHAKQNITHVSYERIRNPLTSAWMSVWTCENFSEKCQQSSAPQTPRPKFPTTRKKGF